MDAGEFIGQFCTGNARHAATALMVVAHPDDETVGAGSRLPSLARGLRVIYTTDGAPRNGHDARAAGFENCAAYACARLRERSDALVIAGIGRDRVLDFRYADQEVSRHLVELALRVEAAIRRFRPAFVITHPYEGGHPDHDATAFSVHAAIRRIQARKEKTPAVIEMTSYHLHDGQLESALFLPVEGVCERVVRLTDEEFRLKRAMLDCYRSQQRTLQTLLYERECFRPAPRYDFSQPPHEGPLYYEGFEWGMNGGEFRNLANAAMQRLEIES